MILKAKMMAAPRGLSIPHPHARPHKPILQIRLTRSLLVSYRSLRRSIDDGAPRHCNAALRGVVHRSARAIPS